MDDLNQKLEDILNDPESMDKVRQMAQNLLGEDTADHSDTHTNSDTADIGRIMSIIGSLQKSGNDNRTKLLLALKPHLTGKRREKIDSAIKLLRLIEALPLLKQAGILDLG